MRNQANYLNYQINVFKFKRIKNFEEALKIFKDGLSTEKEIK